MKTARTKGTRIIAPRYAIYSLGAADQKNLIENGREDFVLK
jgi:hypothetical protein